MTLEVNNHETFSQLLLYDFTCNESANESLTRESEWTIGMVRYCSTNASDGVLFIPFDNGIHVRANSLLSSRFHLC